MFLDILLDILFVLPKTYLKQLLTSRMTICQIYYHCTDILTWLRSCLILTWLRSCLFLTWYIIRYIICASKDIFETTADIKDDYLSNLLPVHWHTHLITELSDTHLITELSVSHLITELSDSHLITELSDCQSVTHLITELSNCQSVSSTFLLFL